ncbi:MAG: hypothetical protein GY771_03295 [bacterium]|nr:hypothetical protein [bacterium]
MKKYNPNQTVRAWVSMPVYSLGVFILGDLLTRFLSWGPIFSYNTWVLYVLFAASIVFWYFTWRAFPVYYTDNKNRIRYRRFLKPKAIPAGDVISVEPIAGRVNLFFRPKGHVINIVFDEFRTYRLYALSGDIEFENTLATAFPGKKRPPRPGV